MPTLFEHAGGEQALHRLEQTFYDSVLADPLLKPLFGDGKPEHVKHIKQVGLGVAHHDRHDALVAQGDENKPDPAFARAIADFFRGPAAKGSVPEHGSILAETRLR